jgi:nucleotide-binding universal stress UspA family protein
MTRIVVGVDGTEQSREAVAWALRHATGRRDSVQAIMTVPTDGLAEPDRLGRLLDAQDTLAEVVEAGTLAAGTIPTRLSRSVVEGDPAAVLVESTRGADLLVLASHHMATLSNPGLSTVSVACIRDGSCPVLVLPSGPPEQPEIAALVPTGTAA